MADNMTGLQEVQTSVARRNKRLKNIAMKRRLAHETLAILGPQGGGSLDMNLKKGTVRKLNTVAKQGSIQREKTVKAMLKGNHLGSRAPLVKEQTRQEPKEREAAKLHLSGLQSRNTGLQNLSDPLLNSIACIAAVPHDSETRQAPPLSNHRKELTRLFAWLQQHRKADYTEAIMARKELQRTAHYKRDGLAHRKPAKFIKKEGLRASGFSRVMRPQTPDLMNQAAKNKDQETVFVEVPVNSVREHDADPDKQLQWVQLLNGKRKGKELPKASTTCVKKIFEFEPPANSTEAVSAMVAKERSRFNTEVKQEPYLKTQLGRSMVAAAYVVLGCLVVSHRRRKLETATKKPDPRVNLESTIAQRFVAQAEIQGTDLTQMTQYTSILKKVDTDLIPSKLKSDLETLQHSAETGHPLPLLLYTDGHLPTAAQEAAQLCLPPTFLDPLPNQPSTSVNLCYNGLFTRKEMIVIDSILTRKS